VPEVVYYVAASLDECIATSDGGIEWLSRFEGKGEDYGYAVFYASIDAVLLADGPMNNALRLSNSGI